MSKEIFSADVSEEIAEGLNSRQIMDSIALMEGIDTEKQYIRVDNIDYAVGDCQYSIEDRPQ